MNQNSSFPQKPESSGVSWKTTLGSRVAGTTGAFLSVSSRMPRHTSSRFKAGFTYVGLLFAIVFFGLGSVGAARVLASSERAEREAELLFAGNQFRQAIGSYYSASPGTPRYPEKLEDLLLDPRFPAIRRHLRKIHVDPITAKAEWGLIRAPQGGIMGVHSLSEREPMKRANFDFADQGFEETAKRVDRPYSYREWQFVSLPASQTLVPPDSGADGRIGRKG